MIKRLTLIIAALALLAVACGDDSGGTPASTSTTAAGGTTADDATTAPATGGDLLCSSLLSLDEVTALFGEPATFDAEGSNEGPGSYDLACSWTTVEDPENLEDLAVQLLFVQVYHGAEYYAPDMLYPNAEAVAGIGQAAYVNTEGSVSTGALDGDLAIFADYSIILGEPDAAIAKKDQVVELLRVIHDRLS
jgi:hypothetical protein